MTDDLEDPRQWRDSVGARFGTLEARVAAVEVTVKTRAQLRATMDFDMGKMQAEFRAQRSMLQALHDTQQDHNRRVRGVEGRLMRVEDRLINVDDRLTNVEGRLTGVEGRLTGVEGKLDLVSAGIEAIHGKLDLLIDRN
jgi:uncharacterized coiled-coil protein SlyX